MSRAFSLKRVLVGIWLMAFPAFLLFWYFPYIDLRIRWATLLVGVFILAGSMVMAWKRKALRWVLLSVYGAILLFLLFPSAPPENREGLRTAYGRALEGYMGCRYVWGGEGCFGIDCSGLVRKGLEDALFTQGLSNLNPALVRESISLYWHDTTAKVMGEGYAGRTYPITTCSSLNVLDYSLVQPGDLAVTASGEHVMIYLGNKKWIAADPVEGKVTQFTIPEEKNFYFSTPMKIMRWTILKDG